MRKTVLMVIIVLSLGSLLCAADYNSKVRDDGKLRIIAFGGHPDDCELRYGGVAVMWAAKGHHVKFVSCTNGDIGHWKMAGGPLAQRRTAEVEEAARILGIETEVLDIHDGELMPTLANRKHIVRLIREWKADLVLSHRPNDYHPDHRYSAILVQDAAFMVTVPFLCPDTPRLTKNPVFMYSDDRFKKPAPSDPTLVISIDKVIEQKLDALAVLDSQFAEGGCCSSYEGDPKDRPGGNPEKDRKLLPQRRKKVRDYQRKRFENVANKYRDKLIELYGEKKGRRVRYAEAFEMCEYGAQPSMKQLKELFPFF